MRSLLLILSFSFFLLPDSSAQLYKDMMDDMSVNFYDVVEEAERHFENIDKTAKGSGWKNFARWQNNNEYKYYPSGRRDNVDHYFTTNSYQSFLKNNPNAFAQRSSSTWLELGPDTISNITGHYAAGLGRVEDFYVDPTNADNIYLGSRSGGFWSSFDGGDTWTGGSTDFLPAAGVNALAVSPWEKDSVLINVANSRNNNSHGVYRSINAGNTWVPTPFNPTNLGTGGLGSNFRVYTIEYHPTIPDLIFVGTNIGLYRSTDNLQTWTRLITAADVTDMDFHPTNPDIVYLIDATSGDRNYVWKSSDKGLTWTASTQIPGNGNRTGYVVTTPDCPNCVFFASSDGVWKSTDVGVNFTFLNVTNGTDDFAVNDQDSDNIIYGNIDIFTSTDGGTNFNQTAWWSLGNSNHGGGNYLQNHNNSPGYVHADLRVAGSVNGVFYIGTDGYLCKSTDNGATWEKLSLTSGIRENYKLGVSQSNHDRTILGSQDNGTTILHETGWIEHYGADGMECIIHPLNADWMISSIQYGGRRRTKNGGQTGGGVTPSGESGSANADWQAPFTYAPNNPMRVYNFSKKVYASDDFGSTWTYQGIPSTFTGNIRMAAIAENNSDIIVIAAGRDIEKSVDGGVTFVDIENGLPNATIQDIAFDPYDDNTMIVTYASYQNNGSKVYITTDGGTTWANITYNLGNMPIHSVVIDHTSDRNIYLGAEIGVYTKTMAANTWSLFNTGMPNTTIEELEIIDGSNTLRAATWGRGLWEISLINRSTFPEITRTNISDTPTDVVPEENVDQFVTSTIEYTGTLSSVYVEWSENDASLGNSITMSNTTGNTWVSDSAIPNFPKDTKIYFKVNAVGASNDTTETYRFMYTVRIGCPVAVDTIPGKSLVFPGGSGNYTTIPPLNLNTNTFTTSAWIKPTGLQNDWAGLVFCRGGSTTSGLSLKSDNELRYHWDGGKWSWSSGAIAPADEWSHVALVVEPTKATIYLNGVPYVNNSAHAVEDFAATTRIGNDANSSGRTYEGEIDELCIWKRALSQNDIRELMHLTKENQIDTDPDLVVYHQFNEEEGKSCDLTGNFNHGTLNSSNLTRAVSTAPVGGGVSSLMTVNAAGVYSFGNTGVKMGFNSGSTYPNGELLVSRLNVAPDQNPTGTNIVTDKTYWIVHNFGSNNSFSTLDSLVFENVPTIINLDESMPSHFNLFKRNSNDFGNTWGTALDPADLVRNTGSEIGKITFSTGNGIGSFSQFVIGDDRGVKVSPRVFLQGAYSGGIMSDNLRTNELLPTAEPYSGLNFNHKNGGGEEVLDASVFTATGNDAIVDWVFVELRDAATPATVYYTRAALVQRDGDVVDLDGTSPVFFRPTVPGTYNLGIRHRNHMGVMSASMFSLSPTPTTVDFTGGINFGTNAQKDLGGSVFGLWMSDPNGSGVIDAADRAMPWNNRNSSVYDSGDLDLDGNVDGVDRTKAWENRNLIEQVPK